MKLDQALHSFVDRTVVLDAAGSIVYLGTLKQVSEVGFWLENADLHDCSEGHAGKEAYVHESKVGGIHTNRKRLFVMRSTVISLAALADVVQEDLEDSSGMRP